MVRSSCDLGERGGIHSGFCYCRDLHDDDAAMHVEMEAEVSKGKLCYCVINISSVDLKCLSIKLKLLHHEPFICSGTACSHTSISVLIASAPYFEVGKLFCQ